MNRSKDGREVVRELKEIEQWALDHGYLAKNLREKFK